MARPATLQHFSTWNACRYTAKSMCAPHPYPYCSKSQASSSMQPFQHFAFIIPRHHQSAAIISSPMKTMIPVISKSAQQPGIRTHSTSQFILHAALSFLDFMMSVLPRASMCSASWVPKENRLFSLYNHLSKYYPVI